VQPRGNAIRATDRGPGTKCVQMWVKQHCCSPGGGCRLAADKGTGTDCLGMPRQAGSELQARRMARRRPLCPLLGALKGTTGTGTTLLRSRRIIFGAHLCIPVGGVGSGAAGRQGSGAAGQRGSGAAGQRGSGAAGQRGSWMGLASPHAACPCLEALLTAKPCGVIGVIVLVRFSPLGCKERARESRWRATSLHDEAQRGQKAEAACTYSGTRRSRAYVQGWGRRAEGGEGGHEGAGQGGRGGRGFIRGGRVGGGIRV
jgi:hypothetical protein